MEVNNLIDRLVAIKDQLNSRYNKDTINEVCGILHKIARGELVEVVRCGDCKHSFERDGRKPLGCYLHGRNGITLHESNDFCNCGERSVENV